MYPENIRVFTTIHVGGCGVFPSPLQMRRVLTPYEASEELLLQQQPAKRVARCAPSNAQWYAFANLLKTMIGSGLLTLPCTHQPRPVRHLPLRAQAHRRQPHVALVRPSQRGGLVRAMRSTRRSGWPLLMD
jgi:hypothetical protein